MAPAAPAGVSLTLIDHVEDLVGEPHGFGSLVFDTQGRLVADGSRTWLYTTLFEDGRWTSWRRSLDLDTLACGPGRRILVPAGDDLVAVIHHVVALEGGRHLALYSNGLGVRAALADGPEGPFRRLDDFALDPVTAWETLGKPPRACSLEANGAFVPIIEDERVLEFWEGYDSYHWQEKRGDLGWVRLRFDKTAATLAVLERHPDNPLRLRPPDWACARCGGNLAADVRIAGRHAFFYYLRPDPGELVMALVLGEDPFMFGARTPWVYDRLLGSEVVAEKFQKVLRPDGTMLLFYESKLRDESWRTGMRRYRF